MHPDDGFKAFLQIYDRYKELAHFSEADTRCKIIDCILKEALGYSEDNIVREPHVDSGFIDYKIIISNSCRFIIEAKRVGDYFQIPGIYSNRNYKVSGIIQNIENLQAAMKQVQKYCLDEGCKYAVVFNGHQIVVFSAIVLGMSWKEGYCFVFHSLEDMKDNFGLLWDVLSYDSIKSGSLITYLDKSKRELNFKRVIDDIYNRDEDLIRNNLYTYLQPISDIVFSELLNEKRTEILRECYVFGKTKLHENLKDYFQDNLPNFMYKYKIKDIIERDSEPEVFKQEYQSKKNVTEGSIAVLLGGIGSGKSTFLHRFFKVVLSEKEKENIIWFYVDFRNSPTDIKEIEKYIFDKIIEEWENKYESYLKEQIDNCGFNQNKCNTKTYITKLFNILQALKFSLTLVIDNVDQHERNFQENIFKVANHIKDLLKTFTIVALREETFLASQRCGVFDAYYVHKFHISSPNFIQLIIKRIDFTIRCLKDIDNQKFLPVIPQESTDELITYFTIIKTSLNRDNSQATKLKNFFDNISVGDMREALRMFSNFIISGNLNVKEIFEKHAVSRSYQISYHQFLKAIILGEHRFYIQDKSNIINLFDFDTTISDSHFNLLRILQYLNNKKDKNSELGRGYILINEIITIAENVSIRKDVIISSLKLLADYNLVELNNLSKKNIKSASYVKITFGGKYYLRYLSNNFVYLDLIFIDTPISNQHTLEKLKELYNLTELSKRLIRTEFFIEYLVSSEEDEYNSHPEYYSNEFTQKEFAKIIKEKFQKEKMEIENLNTKGRA